MQHPGNDIAPPGIINSLTSGLNPARPADGLRGWDVLRSSRPKLICGSGDLDLDGERI
jgi:hypothetical protein